MRRNLDFLIRALLLVNAVGTGAAAVVLAAFPMAIPHVIGLAMTRDSVALCYFLAGAEAGICTVCIDALRYRVRTVECVALRALLVLHASTAALSFVETTGHPNRVIIWNAALRMVMVLLIGISLWSARPGKHATGGR